jgi:hypothetical protein
MSRVYYMLRIDGRTMVHIQPSKQKSLLMTLHVSAPMGHLQVFPFTHYSLIELQRALHTFPLTQVISGQAHFSFTPYLGILTSVGLLYQPDIKVKIAL